MSDTWTWLPLQALRDAEGVVRLPGTCLHGALRSWSLMRITLPACNCAVQPPRTSLQSVDMGVAASRCLTHLHAASQACRLCGGHLMVIGPMAVTRPPYQHSGLMHCQPARPGV